MARKRHFWPTIVLLVIVGFPLNFPVLCSIISCIFASKFVCLEFYGIFISIKINCIWNHTIVILGCEGYGRLLLHRTIIFRYSSLNVSFKTRAISLVCLRFQFEEAEFHESFTIAKAVTKDLLHACLPSEDNSKMQSLPPTHYLSYFA